MAIVSPSPVTLQYGYDSSVITTNKSFYTLDGFYFALSELLSGTKDFATSQDNLLILTDSYSLNDKLDRFEELDKTGIITKSTVSFLSGNTILYLKALALAASANISYTTDINQATVFTLSFDADGISLQAGNFYVTAASSTEDISLQVYSASTVNTTQTFNYTLYNDKAVLFTKLGSNKVLTISSNGNLEVAAYTSTNFTSNQIFYLNRFNANVEPYKGDSNLINYVVAPNDLTINKATSSNKFNYLITTPYKTVDLTDEFINFNITPLKNYYSPEGTQTPTLSTQIREYNKIYTGLNTEDGYDKIYLSYKSSEIEKVFEKDKNTYFHYPVSAANIALSASTLVKAGALGGSSPWRSDRLFVKKANYRKYSNWGNNPGTQNGVFFCSWLSATDTEPVWVDRYYNPSYVNITNVLTSTAFTSAANNYPNLIWDVPSTQTFNPESLYVYHRIGDNDNQLVVDTVSGSLVRYYKTWTTPLINEVTQTNSGELKNYSVSAVETMQGTKDQALDTTVSYGITEFTDTELNSEGITLAFYAYNTDWANLKGSQIVGNFYDGGIGFTKNNTLLTPFNSILNSDINTFNTNLSILKTTPANLLGKNFILKAEYESEYYIVTNDKKILIYDQDDMNICASTFTISGDIIGAHLLKENNQKVVMVFSKSTPTTIFWKKMKPDSALATNTFISSGSQAGYTSYAIDLSGTPFYYNSSKISSTVDRNNVVFGLVENTIYRNINNSLSAGVLSALSAENIVCDHNDNIWVLYSQRNLCKLDNYGNVIWDIYLTDAPIVSSIQTFSRNINFISELNYNTGTIVYSGLVVDPLTQQLFKINSDTGTIVTKTNLVSANQFGYTLGDSTGYDYQRKYVYTEENSNDLSLKLYARGIANNEQSEVTVNLNHDVGTLTPGWHHFAATLDSNNKLKYYIDGTVVEQTTVGAASSVYRVFNNKNDPDILLGTASFKKQTLAEYTKETTDVYRYNGKIADIRFYRQALEKQDIKAIQKRFLLESFTDLNWSAPTGERYYLEQIERLFLHRLPGAKSNLFNIRIRNSNITNLNLRSIIEKNIIAALNKTIPVHTKLNNIIWE